MVNALASLTLTKVFSPTPEHRERFCRDMSAWLDHRFEPVGSVAEAIGGADIVDLVDPSHAPLFETSQLKPGALVLAISGRRRGAGRLSHAPRRPRRGAIMGHPQK